MPPQDSAQKQLTEQQQVPRLFCSMLPAVHDLLRVLLL
jgi:hypothetical protein